MLTERLGMRLRRLRTARGLNQTALAKKADLSQPYVAQLELGLRNPTLDVLRRLAKALRCTVAELVE